MALAQLMLGAQFREWPTSSAGTSWLYAPDVTTGRGVWQITLPEQLVGTRTEVNGSDDHIS